MPIRAQRYSIARRDHRSCSKRVPVLIGTGHRWRIAYVRVSVAAEVDGLIGGVINFEVLLLLLPSAYSEKQSDCAVPAKLAPKNTAASNRLSERML